MAIYIRHKFQNQQRTEGQDRHCQRYIQTKDISGTLVSVKCSGECFTSVLIPLHPANWSNTRVLLRAAAAPDIGLP